MTNIIASRQELLDLRMQWAFAVMATEVNRGRRLGYVPGEERADLVDPAAIGDEIDDRLARSLARETPDPFFTLGLDRAEQDGLWLMVCCSLEPALTCMVEAVSGAAECRLTGKVPLLCNLDALADDKGERLAIVANEFAPLIEGTILVTCGVQRPAVKWEWPVMVIEMGQPTHAQRAKLWLDALGCGTPDDADRLANHYPLAPALIVKAAEAANTRAMGRPMDAGRSRRRYSRRRRASSTRGWASSPHSARAVPCLARSSVTARPARDSGNHATGERPGR